MFDLIDFILNFDEHLAFFIENYGLLVYAFLFLIIFVETGLVVMPFLPGDSLLFVSGTFAAAGLLDLKLLIVLLLVAAILGDAVNYWVGHFFGEKVVKKWIKPEHMQRTQEFYDKHGKKTIILARFAPIVRTIAPFVAGIGKMKYSTFLSYNVIGGTLWILTFIIAGYLLGNFPFVKENLTLITIGIILVFLLPLLSFKKKKN